MDDPTLIALIYLSLVLALAGWEGFHIGSKLWILIYRALVRWRFRRLNRSARRTAARTRGLALTMFTAAWEVHRMASVLEETLDQELNHEEER
mgnify:CR=1 FL=1